MPNEFQEVEWIASSGTQFIDTNYYCDCESELEIAFSCNGQSNRSILGALDNNTGIRLRLYYDRIWFHFGNNYTNPQIRIYGNGNKHIIRLENKIFYFDDVAKSISSTIFDYIAQPIYLFANNNDGITKEIYVGKIFYLKIYNNGMLVRDMIPCYRKTDNEIGMYDLVENIFYTNAGTGTFIKGPDV